MRRSTFFAMIPGLPLLGKLLDRDSWKRWKPVRLPSETYTQWYGPTHFLLLARKAKEQQVGGTPRYFHCNAYTAERLRRELEVANPIRYGTPYGDGYNALRVEGLDWVHSPEIEDDQLWVHSFRCERCLGRGLVVASVPPSGVRPCTGYIPDYGSDYVDIACPDCQRIPSHDLTDEERKWWLREYQEKFGGEGFGP